MKKNEIVRQHDLKDCGVAALQSIIIHYGGYVPIETLRLDCNTTIEGTSAYDIIKTAKKYGFDSYGIKVDSLSNENIIFPCIAHLKYQNGLNHFVVVYEIKKNNYIIMDPNKGKVIMKDKEFNKLWTKNLMIFHPINKILMISKPTSIINTFFTLLKYEKSSLIKLFITSLLLTFISIFCSLYFQIGINIIENKRQMLFLIVVIFFVLTFFKIFFNYLKNKLELNINKNIDQKSLDSFIRHLFLLPLNIFHNRSAGEIMTRINEFSNIRNLIMDILVIVFLDSIMGLFALFILYKITKELFFCLCFLLLLYFIIGSVYSKTIYKKVLKNIDLESEFNSEILHNVEMIDSIKNLRATSNIIINSEKKLFNFLDFNYTFNHFVNFYENCKMTVYEFGLFFINSYGFYLISKGSLDVLELITFNNLLIYLFDPIKNIISLIPKYYYIKASFYKISEFMDISEENFEATDEKFCNGDIEIKNLTYAYNPFKKVINNFSYYIKQNTHIMLKGESGTGKSTLCKILTRTIDNQQGNIIIGGVSVFDYPLEVIRKNILYVGQKESLYPDTIRNNILFNRDIAIDKFNTICKICLVDKIVDKKALRYESLILENAANLSGGERQRIVLARALLQDFKILILDEALSEVDLLTEQKIIKNIRLYFNNKTIIYVSHKNQEILFDKCLFLNHKNKGQCWKGSKECKY